MLPEEFTFICHCAYFLVQFLRQSKPDVTGGDLSSAARNTGWRSIQLQSVDWLYSADNTGWSKSLGAMKNSVYSNNPHTIDGLKMAITENIQNVDRAILNTVFENTVLRVSKRLGTGGGHFEHYL
jgi:hypothetical protein